MAVATKAKKGTKAKVADVNVIAILDMSGSMHGRENETRGGINAFIKDAQADQKAEGGRVTFSLTCFDTRFIQVYAPTDIQQIRPIGPAEYTPAGGTALYDAIGKTLGPLSFPKGEKVLVIITTDGMENSSREWKADAVKALIAEREAQGWEFLMLGVGTDAWSASAAFATPSMVGQTVNSLGTPTATAASLVAASTTSYNMLRSGGTVKQAVSDLYAGGGNSSAWMDRSHGDKRSTPEPTAQTPNPLRSIRRKGTKG